MEGWRERDRGEGLREMEGQREMKGHREMEGQR